MNEVKRLKLMTIKECAKTGLIPENTLRKLCRDNKVPCIKIANRTLICYEALIDYFLNMSAND